MLLNFLIWTRSDGWATAWLFGMVAIGRFMLLKGSKFRKEEMSPRRKQVFHDAEELEKMSPTKVRENQRRIDILDVRKQKTNVMKDLKSGL